MTLNKERWVVRYYLWHVRMVGDRDAVDRRLLRGTSLCAFMARIMFGTAFLCLVTAAGLFFLSGIAYTLYREPLAVLILFGFPAGMVIAVFAACLLVSGLIQIGKSDNMAMAYLRAIKRGICPLIKFE